MAEFQVIEFECHPSFDPENRRTAARCGVNFCLALVELNHTKDYSKIPKDDLPQEPYCEHDPLEYVREMQHDPESFQEKMIVAGYPHEYYEENTEMKNESKK